MDFPSLGTEARIWQFDGTAFRLTMGLRALAPEDWIQLDRTYADLMLERRRLLAERRGDVTALLPEGRAAAMELLDRLAAHLVARFPDLFVRAGTFLHNRLSGESIDLDGVDHPLERVGRLVPEDFCLMESCEGGWRLTGAVLCFPNRWRLGEKLGRKLPGIHAPVPGYDSRLAGPVDRFFDSLKDGRGVWRTNWSLNDRPDLFQPDETAHMPADAAITPDNAGERLFLRIERQTLQHLPRSGAIAFGIRTYQRPLAMLTAEEAGQFAALLRSIPDDTARYKGLKRTAPPALAFLDRLAG